MDKLRKKSKSKRHSEKPLTEDTSDESKFAVESHGTSSGQQETASHSPKADDSIENQLSSLLQKSVPLLIPTVHIPYSLMIPYSCNTSQSAIRLLNRNHAAPSKPTYRATHHDTSSRCTHSTAVNIGSQNQEVSHNKNAKNDNYPSATVENSNLKSGMGKQPADAEKNTKKLKGKMFYRKLKVEKSKKSDKNGSGLESPLLPGNTDVNQINSINKQNQSTRSKKESTSSSSSSNFAECSHQVPKPEKKPNKLLQKFRKIHKHAKQDDASSTGLITKCRIQADSDTDFSTVERKSGHLTSEAKDVKMSEELDVVMARDGLNSSTVTSNNENSEEIILVPEETYPALVVTLPSIPAVDNISDNLNETDTSSAKEEAMSSPVLNLQSSPVHETEILENFTESKLKIVDDPESEFKAKDPRMWNDENLKANDVILKPKKSNTRIIPTIDLNFDEKTCKTRHNHPDHLLTTEVHFAHEELYDACVDSDDTSELESVGMKDAPHPGMATNLPSFKITTAIVISPETLGTLKGSSTGSSENDETKSEGEISKTSSALPVATKDKIVKMKSRSSMVSSKNQVENLPKVSSSENLTPVTQDEDNSETKSSKKRKPSYDQESQLEANSLVDNDQIQNQSEQTLIEFDSPYKDAFPVPVKTSQLESWPSTVQDSGHFSLESTNFLNSSEDRKSFQASTSQELLSSESIANQKMDQFSPAAKTMDQVYETDLKIEESEISETSAKSGEDEMQSLHSGTEIRLNVNNEYTSEETSLPEVLDNFSTQISMVDQYTAKDQNSFNILTPEVPKENQEKDANSFNILTPEVPKEKQEVISIDRDDALSEKELHIVDAELTSEHSNASKQTQEMKLHGVEIVATPTDESAFDYQEYNDDKIHAVLSEASETIKTSNHDISEDIGTTRKTSLETNHAEIDELIGKLPVEEDNNFVTLYRETFKDIFNECGTSRPDDLVDLQITNENNSSVPLTDAYSSGTFETTLTDDNTTHISNIVEQSVATGEVLEDKEQPIMKPAFKTMLQKWGKSLSRPHKIRTKAGININERKMKAGVNPMQATVPCSDEESSLSSGKSQGETIELDDNHQMIKPSSLKGKVVRMFQSGQNKNRKISDVGLHQETDNRLEENPEVYGELQVTENETAKPGSTEQHEHVVVEPSPAYLPKVASKQKRSGVKFPRFKFLSRKTKQKSRRVRSKSQSEVDKIKAVVDDSDSTSQEDVLNAEEESTLAARESYKEIRRRRSVDIDFGHLSSSPEVVSNVDKVTDYINSIFPPALLYNDNQSLDSSGSETMLSLPGSNTAHEQFQSPPSSTDDDTKCLSQSTRSTNDIMKKGVPTTKVLESVDNTDPEQGRNDSEEKKRKKKKKKKRHGSLFWPLIKPKSPK